MNLSVSQKYKVLSNAFFLIPVVLAVYYRIFGEALVVLAVIMFSVLFHISKERKYSFWDETFAVILMGLNLYLSYLSGFREPYFLLILLFICVAFWFYLRHKKFDHGLYHSLWHLSSAIITVLCILAYAV